MSSAFALTNLSIAGHNRVLAVNMRAI
jgi:hypothetical protein